LEKTFQELIKEEQIGACDDDHFPPPKQLKLDAEYEYSLN
jgi:hypothetical protein